MKRKLLIATMSIALSAMALGARAQVQNPWDENKFHVTSEIIQHPIFSKVFPGVEFRVEESDATTPPRRRVFGLIT